MFFVLAVIFMLQQLAASQKCSPSVSSKGSPEGSPHLLYLLPTRDSMTGWVVWKNKNSGRIGALQSTLLLKHQLYEQKAWEKGAVFSVCSFGPSICYSHLSLLLTSSTLLSPQAVWITCESDSTCRSLSLMRPVIPKAFCHLLNPIIQGTVDKQITCNCYLTPIS